jgi:hypothetical protein
MMQMLADQTLSRISGAAIAAAAHGLMLAARTVIVKPHQLASGEFSILPPIDWPLSTPKDFRSNSSSDNFPV